MLLVHLTHQGAGAFICGVAQRNAAVGLSAGQDVELVLPCLVGGGELRGCGCGLFRLCLEGCSRFIGLGLQVLLCINLTHQGAGAFIRGVAQRNAAVGLSAGQDVELVLPSLVYRGQGFGSSSSIFLRLRQRVGGGLGSLRGLHLIKQALVAGVDRVALLGKQLSSAHGELVVLVLQPGALVGDVGQRAPQGLDGRICRAGCLCKLIHIAAKSLPSGKIGGRDACVNSCHKIGLEGAGAGVQFRKAKRHVISEDLQRITGFEQG